MARRRSRSRNFAEYRIGDRVRVGDCGFDRLDGRYGYVVALYNRLQSNPWIKLDGDPEARDIHPDYLLKVQTGMDVVFRWLEANA